MKTLLQRDKALCDFWGAVAHHDDFLKVLSYAFSELAESQLTSEELSGMKKLKEKLLTMADDDSVNSLQISSGIEHDVLGDYQKAKASNQPKGKP